MELKPYQQTVISDLILFLQYLQQSDTGSGPVLPSAFQDYWTDRGYRPMTGNVIEPYKNNIRDGKNRAVPHVCIKVPTAGGKTFIACNALRPIFEGAGFDADQPRLVVWLVPSNPILQQTLRHLRDPNHPYRRKIDTHFNHRVEVYDKAALLSGAGFNAGTVREQLSIVVMSFDSLRVRNKDDRKLYQENGNNLSFSTGPGDTDLLPGTDETAVINVIRRLRPVLIVDESHNAESELSVEMLGNLNPGFILDLTATPRRNSNIISFVDALALKTENMVKLPVIVYNQKDRHEVISAALELRQKLETLANQEQKQFPGSKAIRPIVLFQAQSQTNTDNLTFTKIRDVLVKVGIPTEQIKIKTASLDELKGVDLMAADCPVRYIITVNALKEGWDCPFAYILASLADRSSAVDVEQILGRVLRQPYVRKHTAHLLNLSYVLTASSKFNDTLQSVVTGLNKAGFSRKDFKVANQPETPGTAESPPPSDPLLALFGGPTSPVSDRPHSAGTDPVWTDPVGTDTTGPDEIDPEKISVWDNTAQPGQSRPGAAQTGEAAGNISATDEAADSAVVQDIENQAKAEAEAFAQRTKTMNPSDDPEELQQLATRYRMRDHFSQQATTLLLPQFFMRVEENLFIQTGEEKLARTHLLDGFRLGRQSTEVNFDNVQAELYKVDLEARDRGETSPEFMRVDGKTKDALLNEILPTMTRAGQVKTMTNRLLKAIGDQKPISQKDVSTYVSRILDEMSEAQFRDMVAYQYTYADRIRRKISQLTTHYAQKEFRKLLDTDQVFVKPSFALPPFISPKEIAKDITKSLYANEERMNGFEERVIIKVANLENVAFWTRNGERGRGFFLNGYLNHYPDFIVVTKRGKVVLLETKGDDRDNSDSEAKRDLGRFWAQKSGENYRYFMVFERQELDGTYTLDEFLAVMSAL